MTTPSKSKKPTTSKKQGAKRASQSAHSNGSATKREVLARGGDKRFVRRDEQGQFSEDANVGRSLAQDIKRSHENGTMTTKDVTLRAFQRTYDRHHARKGK